MINNISLPQTDTTATLKFVNRSDAELFAKLYTRKTLMGHSIGGSTVTIWNVTNDIKQWINEYVSQL